MKRIGFQKLILSLYADKNIIETKQTSAFTYLMRLSNGKLWMLRGEGFGDKFKFILYEFNKKETQNQILNWFTPRPLMSIDYAHKPHTIQFLNNDSFYMTGDKGLVKFVGDLC